MVVQTGHPSYGGKHKDRKIVVQAGMVEKSEK
jgi:hypothetical protein